MKRSILLATAVNVMLIAVLQSCSNPPKNVQKSIREHPSEMIEASTAYLGDIEQYRKKTAATIESNQQHIVAYKSGIDAENQSGKYHYRHSILGLELYNSYLEKKLDDYKPEGKESWEIFKEEYTRQMDDLNKEFADFAASMQKAMPAGQYY